MKHFTFRITLVCSFICLAGLNFSCQEDETLNLVKYPENPIQINCEGNSDVKVTGTYDENGKLIFSTPLQKTWKISLATPSPEEVSMKVAPVLVNIPQDKIALSTDLLTIPAGFASGDVTIGLKDDDISFIEDNLSAQTYELGLEITDAEGLNLNTESAKGRLVIEKEQYQSHIVMAGNEGNSIQMKRIYLNNDIMGDPISYSFKLQLDKPAKEDLVINFTTEGISDEFKSSAVFTPSSVTIPVGSKESEEINWTITNDFMKTTAEDENFDIVLKGELGTTNLATLEGDNATINIHVVKTSSILELVNSILQGKLDRSNWSVELGDGWSGDGLNLIDNDSYYSSVSFPEVENNVGEIVLDMKNVYNLVGIKTSFLYKYDWYTGRTFFYSPVKTEIQVSVDKVQWISLGTLEADGNYSHYIRFMVPTQARYVKYKGTVNSELGLIQLTDMCLYSEEE